MTMMSRLVTVLLFLLVVASNGFSPVAPLRSVLTQTHIQEVKSKQSSLVVLHGGKKKSNDDEDLKENPRGFDLFLIFMTPWRNPNSIFVYMFLILYGLGTWKEMHR
jgi:hypothetical protein